MVWWVWWVGLWGGIKVRWFVGWIDLIVIWVGVEWKIEWKCVSLIFIGGVDRNVGWVKIYGECKKICVFWCKGCRCRVCGLGVWIVIVGKFCFCWWYRYEEVVI